MKLRVSEIENSLDEALKQLHIRKTVLRYYKATFKIYKKVKKKTRLSKNCAPRSITFFKALLKLKLKKCKNIQNT